MRSLRFLTLSLSFLARIFSSCLRGARCVVGLCPWASAGPEGDVVPVVRRPRLDGPVCSENSDGPALRVALDGRPDLLDETERV